jgi:ATP synthase protein I
MDKTPEEKENGKRRRSLEALARYSGMTFQLAAVIIIFIFIGKWLDTKIIFKFPVFTVALSFLGVFVGIYFVIKDVLKHK